MTENAKLTIRETAALSEACFLEAAEYVEARDRYIVNDPEVLGGTSIISGTRLSVYAILGRLQCGDTLGDLTEDYPHIPKEAFGAAALYAKANPLRGRPSGRPWRNAD